MTKTKAMKQRRGDEVAAYAAANKRWDYDLDTDNHEDLAYLISILRAPGDRDIDVIQRIVDSAIFKTAPEETQEFLNQYLDLMKEDESVEKKMGVGLDRSPKTNWIEDNGGLPKYIEEIATSLHKERGMSIERAIRTALSRVKVWAAGGDNVKPNTKAKAAKALAEWQAMKAARAKAKDASK